MTDSQVTSWIFYAIAMASEKKPVGITAMYQTAAGINHAVPTQKEFELAITWLLKEGLVKKEGRTYTLTKNGHIYYSSAQLHTTTISNVWKNLERQLKN